MRVEVVAVGTELLLGQIVDTNSSWIGEQLALAGLDSHYQTKVGDNPARIREVFEQALERSDAVICCGGLGPTQDDLTRDVIAEMLGVELVRDDVIAERIAEMFRSRGRTMSENNLRQAMVPVGSRTIPQQPGTAPGLICPVPRPGDGEGGGEDKVIYAVPGVPYEMKIMVTETIVPDLIERSGEKAVIRSRVLRTWGVAESALAEILADRITELDAVGNPTIAFLASGVEGIKVRVTAKAPTEAEATPILDAEEARLRDVLGDIVFGLDEQNMEAVVTELLAEAGHTLAVGEAITGGYVAGRLNAAPQSATVFRGGLVIGHQDEDAGEAAALALAHRVREQFGADVGLANTVASASDTDGAAPGSVALAMVLPQGASAQGASAQGESPQEVTMTVALPGDRERIRQMSTITLLNLVRKALENKAD